MKPRKRNEVARDDGGEGLGFVAGALMLYLIVYIVMNVSRKRGVTGQGGFGVSMGFLKKGSTSQPLHGGPHASSKLSGKGSKSKVTKHRSSVDGVEYYVASDLPAMDTAANKLAEIQRRSQYLLQEVKNRLEDGRRVNALDGVDITDNMRRLVETHYGKLTPFAEYHNPADNTVGSNSNKGELIEICLRSKKDPAEWNTDNTLLRVHVHELAHSADHHYRGDGDVAHGPDFFRLHKYLLRVAEDLGVYNCEKFKASEGEFCGLRLTEEPYC